MAGAHIILDDIAFLFSGEGRNPGRCASSAVALPWAPACAGEQLFGERDR